MELKTTLNTYKRTNCSMEVSQDLKEVEAYGYDWFKYLHTDSVGNIILSEFSSMTSRDHIGDIVSILNRHGLKISLRLDFINGYSDVFRRSILPLMYYKGAHEGHDLKYPIKAINSEIKLIRDYIYTLIEKYKTPRTWKRTKENIKSEIKRLSYRLKDLRNFRDNYLDKKLYPFKNQKIEKLELKIFGDYNWKNRQREYCLDEIKAARNWFLKKNGKLDRNSYKDFLNKISGQWHPDFNFNLDKLKDLFSLSNDKLKEVLHYRFIKDTNDMIPLKDSAEFVQLIKWLKRMNINKKNLNTLNLDKIHTYLTNKINRKTYQPKDPLFFNLHEKLLRLETLEKHEKYLKLIKSDKELRAEGRSQGHCIGGQNYIKKCLRGYQALNYKGYTFFLDSQNNIIETHGRHNTYTPHEIRNELINEIQAA